MTEEAADHLCNALRLVGDDRALAREIDEDDLAVLQAITLTIPITTGNLAGATRLSVDQVNLSLFKLLRLAVLRLDGERWQILKEDIR